jgi:hypothetical protein
VVYCSLVELQQRARQAAALLRWMFSFRVLLKLLGKVLVIKYVGQWSMQPVMLSAVLLFDVSCEQAASCSSHTLITVCCCCCCCCCRLPPVVLSAVLPFDGSCEELEAAELEEARSLSFLDR